MDNIGSGTNEHAYCIRETWMLHHTINFRFVLRRMTTSYQIRSQCSEYEARLKHKS